MGTSKSYSPPTTPQWTTLKTEVTRATGSNLSSDSAQHLVRGLIRASDGSAAIAGGSGGGGTGRAALSVAGRARGFFGSIASGNVDSAFNELGVQDWSNKSPGELRAILLDSLAPEAGTQDEADAREALAELIAEALRDAQDATQVAAGLDSLTAEGPVALLARYAALYVYAKFKKTFYEYELKRKGSLPTNQMLAEVREYLVAAAQRMAKMPQKGLANDWKRANRQFTSRLMHTALAVFCGEDS